MLLSIRNLLNAGVVATLIVDSLVAVEFKDLKLLMTRTSSNQIVSRFKMAPLMRVLATCAPHGLYLLGLVRHRKIYYYVTFKYKRSRNIGGLVCLFCTLFGHTCIHADPPVRLQDCPKPFSNMDLNTCRNHSPV